MTSADRTQNDLGRDAWKPVDEGWGRRAARSAALRAPTLVVGHLARKPLSPEESPR
ncbi:hypothetical protein SAMN04489712_103432 [Thermomonospora echinospora]|uniref:Uncharacterized protein n=1 Tax=Thermomonospora echinospora TaxID=1992 RepID=A0A1H5XVX9_9ACTN|nr:hypothetical protein SAMN04489712_103432 [Thermomonospora echinospora]